MNRRFTYPLLALLVWLLNACQEPALTWERSFPKSGSYSSPRAADLNRDGVKDIVMGAGGNAEWEPTAQGVIALNGRNGEPIWQVPCRNEMVGTPVFYDLTGDSIPEVFIGGRSAQFLCINGQDGSLLWEYLPHEPGPEDLRDTSLLNFFTPTLIPDQNQDGHPDLLTAFGGFVAAAPYDENRPSGQLLLLSARTGELLHRAFMPDGRETYCSPVLHERRDTTFVLFGTGGESLPGNLYITPLDDVLDNHLGQAEILAAGDEKGFIAPPVFMDLNGDQQPDIIVNAYEGHSLALDGTSLEPIWEVRLRENLETHAQPALGQFVGDATPDVFVNYRNAPWPEAAGSLQCLIDGRTGQVQLVDSLGNWQMASPKCWPASRNAPDGVIMTINQPVITEHPVESGLPALRHEFQLLHLSMSSPQATLLYAQDGINLGTTPLLDDLNGDGIQEIVFAFNHNPYDFQSFEGFTIRCQPLLVP